MANRSGAKEAYPERSRWIADDIDVSDIVGRLPSYMGEMVGQIEAADAEGNLPVYVQVTDDLDIYAKNLVPDLLTTEEWHRLSAKYSLPEDQQDGGG